MKAYFCSKLNCGTHSKVRRAHFFKSAKEFRQKILDSFSLTWPDISEKMRHRINDNFETLKPVVSF
jgi:hypothetical protein